MTWLRASVATMTILTRAGAGAVGEERVLERHVQATRLVLGHLVAGVVGHVDQALDA